MKVRINLPDGNTIFRDMTQKELDGYLMVATAIANTQGKELQLTRGNQKEIIKNNAC